MFARKLANVKKLKIDKFFSAEGYFITFNSKLFFLFPAEFSYFFTEIPGMLPERILDY